MIALLSLWKIEDGHYDEMDAFAQRGPEMLGKSKGFISAVYISDKEKNEYGTLTVWETQEDCTAAIQSLPNEVGEKLRSWAKESPVNTTYYVNNTFSA